MELTTGTIIGLILVGVAAGMLSGLVGIGGGLLIVPCLVLIFGFAQKEAQGTSLALLSIPVTLVAAYTYHKGGHVDWKVAMILAIGFIIGGYFGGKIVLNIETAVIKKIFAVALIAVAFKYLFFDK